MDIVEEKLAVNGVVGESRLIDVEASTEYDGLLLIDIDHGGLVDLVIFLDTVLDTVLDGIDDTVPVEDMDPLRSASVTEREVVDVGPKIP